MFIYIKTDRNIEIEIETEIYLKSRQRTQITDKKITTELTVEFSVAIIKVRRNKILTPSLPLPKKQLNLELNTVFKISL